jgi:lipopolysaccharide assembly outer membrane protein LptD (OstA)
MIRSISALAGVIALLPMFAAAAPTPSPRPQRPVTSPSGLPSGAPRANASPKAPGTNASPKAQGPNASPQPAPASFDLGVWTVHANSLDANFKNGNFSTPAKVVMTRVGGDVTADRANGNYKKQLLFLNGHVIIHDTQGSAESLTGGATPQEPSPSTLTADKAQIDGAAKTYKAIGNVHYVQADTTVDADSGTLNDATHDLLLEGTVHIVQGTRSMRAHRVLYNTLTGTAHAQGDVTMQFPSELHRRLATPKPLKIPKNGLTQPVVGPSARP